MESYASAKTNSFGQKSEYTVMYQQTKQMLAEAM